MIEPNQAPEEARPKKGSRVVGRPEYVHTYCFKCNELAIIHRLRFAVETVFICNLCRLNQNEEENRPAQRLIFDHHPEGQRIAAAKIALED